MKGGKEKASTSSSSCEDHNEEYLLKTPAQANHEKLEAIGTICCPSCSHKFEPTPEVISRKKKRKKKSKGINN
jgi:hypothetical protein